jgi:tetratricopeptide (TPR) repeat protein
MKESTAPSPSEVGAKPSVENDSKAPSLKPEQPESEKVAEKTPAAEPGAEAPASLQPSKPAGAGKSAVGGGIGAPKAAAAGKLTQAERKKQTEVQKREETQRAAEQSYEAGLQFIRESRDADAIKAFRQTVKLAPDSADAWLRLAYLCEKEGKTEEAMRAFKEAKRLWSF